jgi:hypothetical protein
MKIKYPKQVTNYCNRIIKKKAQYIIKNVSSHHKGVLSVSEIYQIEKVILLDGHLNGDVDTRQTRDTCKTRGETDASFSLTNGKQTMENHIHKTKMHKVCLPPKVGVLQKLVLMNLSQDCNLHQLK